MSLNGKQKKYLKKNLKKKNINQIASDLSVSSKEIKFYLQKIWGKKKLQRFLNKNIKNQKFTPENNNEFDFKNKIIFFNFKVWFDKNLNFLILLAILVFAAYFNSLFNQFVSDDIYTFLKNEHLGEFGSVFSSLPLLLRPFLNCLVVNIFGNTPIFYRLLNIFFHLGTVLIVYFLMERLSSRAVALFAAAVLAVHPLQTEAVSWISGGIYSQYSFFIILALAAHIFSLKNKKFYFISLAFFLLALLTSEKAMVYPFILLTLMIAFKIFWDLRKLAVVFFIDLFWVGLYMIRIPQRISELQSQYYQDTKFVNPLFQIPIALSSYIELVFFPKGLALYHSEMLFNWQQFVFKAVVVLGLISLIIYNYFKGKWLLFFWLTFFIISLLPTLTPFGISWIVAERYVYLGAIGIFTATALIISSTFKVLKLKEIYYYLFLFLIVLLLLIRTIVRNNDWKNEDNLWIAAAKTSPNSAQNHNNLGDMYGRNDNLPKAAEEFQKAIQLQPNYADAYHNLANTYSNMEELDKAIESYQQALKFNPNLWQSHQNLGAIYLKQKKTDLAKNHFEKALQLNPDNQKLQQLLLNLPQN